MKNTLTIPKGYELDLKKSSSNNIVLKKKASDLSMKLVKIKSPNPGLCYKCAIFEGKARHACDCNDYYNGNRRYHIYVLKDYKLNANIKIL
jgi:hypothetical protein